MKELNNGQVIIVQQHNGKLNCNYEKHINGNILLEKAPLEYYNYVINYKYGLGNKRTLWQWYEYIGFDYQKDSDFDV